MKNGRWARPRGVELRADATETEAAEANERPWRAAALSAATIPRASSRRATPSLPWPPMATPTATALSSCRPSPSSSSTAAAFRWLNITSVSSVPPPRRRLRLAPLHVVDDSKEVQVEASAAADRPEERSQTDTMVDGMDFGELCNDFECISSPYVESTARQIARDILELREDNRAFNCYAVSVKYKDPLRTFVGREKYMRPLWITKALEKPVVKKNHGPGIFQCVPLFLLRGRYLTPRTCCTTC
ncbi:unnamed protein product [Urochloa decumbens]